MKQNSIKLDGKTYPFRVTMGAMLRFKRACGNDLSELDPTDVEGLLRFMWCCVKSASAADGAGFDLSFEDFADHITPEAFSELCAELNAGDQKKTPMTVAE